MTSHDNIVTDHQNHQMVLGTLSWSHLAASANVYKDGGFKRVESERKSWSMDYRGTPT